jgi:hypothetical protein
VSSMKHTTKGKNRIVFLFVAFTLFSCSRYTLEDVVKEVDTNEGYYSESTNGDMKLRLQYLPKEYMVALEQKSRRSLTPSTYRQKINEYGRSVYFRLSISKESGDDASFMLDKVRDISQYSQKWNHFNYGMRNSLFLVSEKYDTLYPSNYLYLNPTINSGTVHFFYLFDRQSLEKELSNDGHLNLKFVDLGVVPKSVRFDLSDFKDILKKDFEVIVNN